MQDPRTRTVAAAVAALVGAFFLFVGANTATPANLAFWAMTLGGLLFAGLAWFLMRFYRPGYDVVSADEVDIRDWDFWRFLRYGRAAAPFYLGLRLFVGYTWLTSGWGKLQNPAWVQTGEALKGFWERALGTQGEIVYPAYRALIQFMLDNGWYTWMGKAIPLGELLIGLGFLFGGLIGVAAFFALLLNFSFLLAGTTSSNPVLILLELGVILGWRVAGWWGLDRWLLPRLGTPWAPGGQAAEGERAHQPSGG
jgi:thiosulfate dehydrogenase [quinone] large subunit